LLALAALSSAAPAPAEAQTTSQFELWLALPTTVDVGDDLPRVQLWFDAHVRRGPAQTTAIFRPGIGLRIYQWMLVYLGYAYIPSFVDTPQEVRNEHRIWEQLILDFSPTSQLAIQSRTRFEQRFSDQGDDVALRLRQFVRFLWKPPDIDPVAFVLWDEIFIGLTDSDWGPTVGFDQNRLFVGPAVLIGGVGRIELGYLYNYLRRNPIDVHNHVLYTQFVIAI